MTGRWKALAWTLGGVIALVGLVWLGSFLFWHVRITSAIKSWETEGRPKKFRRPGYALPPEAGAVLHHAGCRALPYLVSALESHEGDPEFQEGLIVLIISKLGGPGPYTDESFELMGERSTRWEFVAEGLDFERKEKLADFKSWWTENGRHYHAWWKTWSPWCREER